MGQYKTIGDVVQKDTPSVNVDDNLRTAIFKLAATGESAMIVKSGDELVGILTDLDLMDSLVKGDDIDTTAVSAMMSACELIGNKGAKNPCIQLDIGESVENALNVMHVAGVHHLLVSDGSKGAIGVVAARDLLKDAIA